MAAVRDIASGNKARAVSFVETLGHGSKYLFGVGTHALHLLTAN